MNAHHIIQKHRADIVEQAEKGMFDLENFTAWFMRVFDADLDEYSKDNFGLVREALRLIWKHKK